MNDGLRGERLALPLAEAAVRLGISAEVLRLRLDRGEARGFDRDGTSFVYVNDLSDGLAAERRFGGAATDLSRGQTDRMPADGALPVVVEFQKLELTRLLRENERLNTRLDQLFDEIRHLRDMQQREQVLRQQEQVLRRQGQETLDRLSRRPVLPSPDIAPGKTTAAPTVPSPEPSRPPEQRPELVLTQTVTAKSLNAKKLKKNATKSSRQASPAYLATGRNGRGFVRPDRREPHAVMPSPGKPLTRGFSATSVPASASSAVYDGAIGPEEAAELAVILNDIGQSLRHSEAFRAYPPIKPGPAPQRAGDRRSIDVLPDRAAAKPVAVEESALLAILDSMGPTAEDRHNTARDLRQLLRNRLPPRSGDA